jgi:hypothetical protein
VRTSKAISKQLKEFCTNQHLLYECTLALDHTYFKNKFGVLLFSEAYHNKLSGKALWKSVFSAHARIQHKNETPQKWHFLCQLDRTVH